MSKSSFSKPPLTPEEKTKKADAFINQETLSASNNTSSDVKKIPTKQILLRLPQNYIDDIKKIIEVEGKIPSLRQQCLIGIM